MANLITRISITHDQEAAQDLKDLLIVPTDQHNKELKRLVTFLNAIGGGNRNASVNVQPDDGVAASGSIAFSGISTANDTILINGVTFTAVASGATGNQWNVKGTAALQAAEVIAKINASATALVVAQVVASLTSTATVTITSLDKGVSGNQATIAKGTDAGSVMTVSGARLTGGTARSSNVYKFGV